MKYIKFIAKADTWYKEGTEAFLDINGNETRISNDEYKKSWEGLPNHMRASFFIGIRECDDNPNENGNGYTPGELRVDGEYCNFDEFEIIETDVWEGRRAGETGDDFCERVFGI